MAVDHDGSHVSHVGAVAQRRVGGCQRLGLLVDRFGFSGERGFLDLQIDAFQDPSIRGNELADFQNHDVTGHEFRRGDLVRRAVTSHANGRHRHSLQGSESFFGTIVLNESQRRIQDHNRQDDNRIGVFVQKGRHAGRDDQQDDHRFAELFPENPPRAATADFDQLVRAVLSLTRFHLRSGQPGGPVTPQLTERRFGGETVPSGRFGHILRGDVAEMGSFQVPSDSAV